MSIWGHQYLGDFEALELAEVTGSVDRGERKPESCSLRKGRKEGRPGWGM